jgi:hypothetical protein
VPGFGHDLYLHIVTEREKRRNLRPAGGLPAVWPKNQRSIVVLDHFQQDMTPDLRGKVIVSQRTQLKLVLQILLGIFITTIQNAVNVLDDRLNVRAAILGHAFLNGNEILPLSKISKDYVSRWEMAYMVPDGFHRGTGGVVRPESTW